LLESGSDRTGALDFQASPTDYVARGIHHATLVELAESAALVEAGMPLTPELADALLHGSSLGGARPKALLDDGHRQHIAKFSSTTDTYPVVKAEFVAMKFAARVGLDVPAVALTEALGKDVLLVERFDRPNDGTRRAIVSALTILGLSENEAFYGASYAQLANIIRQRFTNPDASLRELFARITLSILVSNNDDHARNHAAYWDGAMLTLTPAYDICPQLHSGGETRQLMAIGDDGYRMSQLIGCVERSRTYHLEPGEAREIIDHQVEVINTRWTDVCDAARLTENQRNSLWKRQFLNDYALYNY
jgi:serine/threonine-protein kinase HipA